MRFSDLRFPVKLGASFGVIIAGLIASSALLYVAIRDADRATQRNDAANGILLALGQAGTAHLDLAHTARGYLITKVERHAMLYGQATKLFAEKMKDAKDTARDIPEVLPLLQAVEAASNDWRIKTGDPMMKFALDAKTYDQAIEVAKSQSASVQQQAFREKFEAATTQLTTLTRETSARVDARLTSALMSNFAGAGLALFVSIAAYLALVRTTATPVTHLTDTMRTLASGNHNIEVPHANRRDEIGQMAQAVLTFREGAIAREQAEADARLSRHAADDLRSSSEAERLRDIKAAQETCRVLDEALDRLANGDFSHAIDTHFPGELDTLRISFNKSVAHLRTTMRTLMDNSRIITSGIDEIATASNDLSRRTEQQAASLEEAAAAAEQTATMVRNTAEGATHAHAIVTRTREDVEQGGKVVERSVAAMGDIEKASRQIHDFIGIIDEIAFQTNLLALNAGVEAARAGEAGRGFAVVASEVRALAQRSATAAQQVKELVGHSAKSISDGVTLVNEAGAALVRITEQIGGIDRVVSQIAAGTREQALGLDQLNGAIRQIDDATQQNAAMAEETSAAVEQVANEAQHLRHLVQGFTIDEPTGRAARAA